MNVWAVAHAASSTLFKAAKHMHPIVIGLTCHEHAWVWDAHGEWCGQMRGGANDEGGVIDMSRHPWEILPTLVEAGILTSDEAKGIVLAHEDANRRALQEIHALLPELVHAELLDPRGAQKIQHVVVGVTRRGMPDL